MEYSIHKEELQNDLLVETLHVLDSCYRQLGAEVYVVGAAARDIALRLLDVNNTPRRTMDLDVAVLLQDWSQYKRLTSILLQNPFCLFLSDSLRWIAVYYAPAHEMNPNPAAPSATMY